MKKNMAKKIVIVGGGTAGWMTAAAITHLLGKVGVEVVLIESDSISTIGVGEATIPHLRYFNERLGLDENEFMRETNATFKLGIEFDGWGAIGESYIHPFGEFGQKTAGIHFHHHWLNAYKNNGAHPIFDYSLPVAMAELNKFEYPKKGGDPLLSSYSYAFHIDASRYAQYLRKFAEGKGLSRIEGIIEEVRQDSESGDIASLTLDSGDVVEGDFFIDCSGFRSLLLGDALGVEFIDWSHWLPCDKAIAAPTAANGPLTPYTKATAHGAGWQWRIPLQHRVGNGFVYSSAHLSDDEAASQFTSKLDGETLADLKWLRFKAGRRSLSWSSNCVAIGLSGGFLEPLESTSIYLIQVAIMKLIDLFPEVGSNQVRRDEFNRQMTLEYERIRDFIILHYHATRRTDTAFWDHCRTMEVPDSLKQKMECFEQVGHIVHYEHGLFLVPSWLAVYIGQGIIPRQVHPVAELARSALPDAYFDNFPQKVMEIAEGYSTHEAFISRIRAGSDGQRWPEAAMSLYHVFS